MLAVKLNNVGKKYIISHEKEALVRHVLPRFLRIKTQEELWAISEINLEIKHGESIGVIGRNGAGKTTLFNVISGIAFPTEGKIFLNGKVSALLSLGAGFHSELTGEENIYINGAILGLRIKEIRRRFRDIAEFSELGDFISAPLQTYSQGMYMRLGFAIAINVDFDILLMDEILTVGDISFQNKCLNRLKELRQKGKTLLMISQSADLLNQLCDRVLLLEKGKIISDGAPGQVALLYQDMMSQQAEVIPEAKVTEKLSMCTFTPESKINKEEKTKVPTEGWSFCCGTKEAEIEEVKLINSRNKEAGVFTTGEKMKVCVKYLVHKDIENPHFGIAIFREDGIYCYGPNTQFDGLKINKLKKGRGEFSLEYKNINLLPGAYRISVAIWETEEKFAYDNHYAFYKFSVISDKKDHGILYLEHKWRWRLP